MNFLNFLPNENRFLQTFALVGFALNSLLRRLALGTETTDAASFTAVRLISGAFITERKEELISFLKFRDKGVAFINRIDRQFS